jgi:hypothetical protein
MDRRINKKYMYGIYNPGIVDSHVFFYFNHNGFAHLAVYDRMEKVTLCLRANLIFDDMFYGGFNNFTLSNSYKNHFVGVIEPSRMNLNHESVLNQPGLVININDNPIIAIYDFH